MTEIEKQIDSVRSRLQRLWLWKCVSIGLLVGGLAGCLTVLIGFTSGSPASWQLIAGILSAPPIIGAFFASLRPQSVHGAATEIDHSYRLKDRVESALRFMSNPEQQTVIHQLQLADTNKHLAKIDPKTVAPMKSPRSWTWGILTTGLALTLSFVLLTTQESVNAAPVGNDVVLSQANHVEESLKELEEFNEQEIDPEIEKLLEDLSDQITLLKEPTTDPKEALANLSLMETMLKQHQQKLNDPSTELALQAMGKAFELAEPLAAAGQAMSEGKMEEAAEKLEKLDLPKLDRQTEKALKEKLEEAAQNAGGGSNRSLKEATKQISQSLSQGNRKKFQDGIAKLAGECRKQGRRKKLSDLLMKQCKCLSECKGECESECKSKSLNNNKGGNSWGLAASGNQPGDKTSLLKSPNEMKIKGQESEGGDVETETLSSDPEQQAAARQYREQVQKYEQLSESVLDNEPIPLGHKQTIRKYFELIRPSQGEVDQVDEVTNQGE